jgi:hypothetical protein
MVSTDGFLVGLTAAYSLATPIIAAVYWRSYGPAQLSMVIRFTLVPLLSRERLLASMPAVGVLALELGWAIDFLAGGRLIGIAAYMFDEKLSLPPRSLSLFHLALPPTLLFCSACLATTSALSSFRLC